MLLLMTIPPFYKAIMEPLVESYSPNGEGPSRADLQRAKRLTEIGLGGYFAVMSVGMAVS